MGIFKRIQRIASSYINDVDSGRTKAGLQTKDGELKKIIDELNSFGSRREERRKNEAGSNENMRMSKERAYSILRIDSGASKDEIKSTYKKLVAKYHPDKVASLGEELKELAEKKTKDINDAYSYLKAQNIV